MTVARVSEEGGWAVRYPGKKCQSLAFSKVEEGADNDDLCQAWMPCVFHRTSYLPKASVRGEEGSGPSATG